MHIKKSTFDFFSNLGENNNREWFQANKDAYTDAHKDVKNFVEGLIDGLSEFDPHINRDIGAGKCMFRIYRDVRFSKDKSPYKNWLAAGISIDGRKLEGPEYYIHVGPGKSFIACGYWRPNKEHLAAIRQEIDYNSESFIDSLHAGSWTIQDLSEEDKLVRPPAGFSADDPNIELLKLKSFIIFKTLTDEQLMENDALEEILDICRRVHPFKTFLHDAISN